MSGREESVTEYLNVIKENTLHLMKAKPSQNQVANMLKQRVLALGMGNTSDQVLVDIASGMIAYKLMFGKK